MTKVVIIPLGLVVDTNMQRTITEFNKLGVSKASILWHWLPLPNWLEKLTGRSASLDVYIDSYKNGNITTEQFRKQMRLIFPQLGTSDEAFDKAWNAMCVVTDVTRQAFEDADKLVASGITVYFLSSTNPLHTDHIRQTYGKVLPGNHYYSYEKRRLGNALQGELLKEIKEKNPDIKDTDIILYFKSPGPQPYPNLGAFSWIYAPFKMLAWHRANQFVNKMIQDNVRNPQLTLVPIPKGEGNDTILASVKSAGWYLDKSESTNSNLNVNLLETGNTFTPGQDLHQRQTSNTNPSDTNTSLEVSKTNENDDKRKAKIE